MTGTIDGIELPDGDKPYPIDTLQTGAPTPEALLEQAKGVLIFRYGIDEVSAAGLLRGWADATGADPQAVAHALVYAICQGRDVGPADTQLARWLEDRMRHELTVPTTPEGRRQGAPGGG